MRLLYLAHRVPYPPNKGDKIRSYHHVRHLAAHHDVALASFVDQEEDWAAAEPLRAFCAAVELVPLKRMPALLRGAWALAGGGSLSEGFYATRSMRAAVARLATGQPFDVAWAFSSTMAQYLDATDARWRVADFVDLDSEKWRQFGNAASLPLAQAYRLEAVRFRAAECRIARRVDRTLLVSEAEAARFRTICPEATNVRVIPNGVDTDYFHPGDARAADPVLLFTGALDYHPNIDAVRFFVKEVLPLVAARVPAVRLVVVGHRPVARLSDLAARSGGRVLIAGSVPDIRPYFAGAQVYVAPLRLGRGVQNKVLEAMAMGLPVVASSTAVAGIAISPGREALVADAPAAMADAIVTLLGDAGHRAALADAATQLVNQRYTWPVNLSLVDRCLRPDEAVAPSTTARAATTVQA